MRGGAAGLEGFLEMLKPLRQPLTVQLNDRSVHPFNSVALHCTYSARVDSSMAGQYIPQV